MADPTQDLPADAAPDDAGDDMSKGYCIEIKVKADGTISVGVESLPEEDAEESAGSAGDADPEEANDGAQEVSSIREAIKIVMDIYQHSGEIADAGADQAQMSSGYEGR